MKENNELLEKGTIVYLDGITCQLGEIDRVAIIDGEASYVMSATVVDGEFYQNNGKDNECCSYPVECCGKASDEDIKRFNEYKSNNR